MSDSSDSSEKGFNDDELQDIMAEIETLEREFVEGNVSDPEESMQEIDTEPAQQVQATKEPVKQTAPQIVAKNVSPAQDDDDDDDDDDGMDADSFAQELASIEKETAPKPVQTIKEVPKAAIQPEVKPIAQVSPAVQENVTQLARPEGREINFSGQGAYCGIVETTWLTI